MHDSVGTFLLYGTVIYCVQHSGLLVMCLFNDHVVMGSTLHNELGDVVCTHHTYATKQYNLVLA